MLALTVYQPWAALLVTGAKRYETRPRPVRFTGYVAIHASKKTLDPRVLPRVADALVAKGIRGAEDLHTGAIIGLVEIVQCLETRNWRRQVSDQEVAFGNWGDGRYAIQMARAVRLVQPVPAIGKQGWWRLDDAQERALVESLQQAGQMTMAIAVALDKGRRQHHAKGSDGDTGRERHHLD